MTVAIAWVRKIAKGEELIFVADSRLSGDAFTFDACPKILTLPRDDCAICFAGYTGHAYPMMLQLALAIDSHPAAMRRSLSLPALKTHVLKVFNGMAHQIKPSIHVNSLKDNAPNATFLFGGYSWVSKKFRLWSIAYNSGVQSFEAHPAYRLAVSKKTGRMVFRNRRKAHSKQEVGYIAFAGDQALLAKRLLLERVNATGFDALRETSLDWVPFEVVRDMLRDPNHGETIGGSPQVVKVYEYMRTTTLGVYWPDKQSGQVYLRGRACLAYEQIDRWVLDPDTLVSERQPISAEASAITPMNEDGAQLI